jgi:uncharacterized protein YneF (UPF0154 family)/predicted RNA-binding Zn-ribbon protein involved in translation (DUF1610 family)
MAQVFPRFCPQCGATIAANQQFCPQCGLDIALRDAQSAPQGTQQGNPMLSSSLPYSSQPIQHASSSAPEGEVLVPEPHSARKRSIGRPGILILLLVLLMILGTVTYVSVGIFGSHFGTQPPITTASIQTTVTYAGVMITALDAQQSQRFLDDANTSTSGMVRVHLQAQNKTTVPVNLVYTTITRLVLPGGTVISPVYVKSDVGVAPGVTRTSLVDFAVPSTLKISQLILRLGAANEAQIDIPLTGHADMSKYAPKTTNLNGQLQYLGLNWTLVSATSQLSIDGQQASKGMRYVTITLKIDNTLSQVVIAGSAYDYIRLKAGNRTLAPVNTTLPVSIEAGAKGKIGTITFLVPQNATTLTLSLASQSNSGFDQASIDIQVT